MTKLIWIILLQFIAVSPIFSQYKNYSEIKSDSALQESISKKVSNITHFSCELNIEHSRKFSSNINIELGSILFQKPNNIAWVFYKPNLYTIVINGSEASTNENGFFEEYNLEQNTDFTLANSLFTTYYNKFYFKATDYEISFYKDKYTFLIRLIPLKNKTNSSYNNIELIVNKIDYGLVGIRLNKTDDSIVKYTFSDRIVNGKLDQSVFKVE